MPSGRMWSRLAWHGRCVSDEKKTQNKRIKPEIVGDKALAALVFMIREMKSEQAEMIIIRDEIGRLLAIGNSR
jgi:hypothetical protein